MNLSFKQLRTFCLAYEHGSFTQAAQIQGISPQGASRVVAKVEGELGVVLFRRNTRHMEATQAGHLYYKAAREALDLMGRATSLLQEEEEGLAGLVRISVPTSYGHHRFMKVLAMFRQEHPGVRVDVQIHNRNIDFVREGFDLAIRMGSLGDALFVARGLGQFRLGVFASPGYLSAYGTPRSLEDLEHHEVALFVMPSTGKPLPWSFEGESESHVPGASVLIREDVLGLVSFAKAGGGLVQTYHYLVEHELERGELVEVLEELNSGSRPFSLIYPKESSRQPHVRALIEFLVDQR